MFEAGFTYILSKSLMNTRTKTEQKLSLFFMLKLINYNKQGLEP